MISRDDAERLTERIRDVATSTRSQIDELAALVDEARGGEAHAALGYPSWTAYLVDALGGTLALDRGSTRDVVALLAGEGMSSRAIAPIVGVSHMTVQRISRGTDVPPAPVTGLDGKTYTPPPVDETRQREAAERQARTDLYTGIARALQTVGVYGGYPDVRRVMAEYDPTELDPPQIARAFTRANLTAARRLIDGLIDWSTT